WKREVLAYQSGILEDLGGGLVVPRVYAVMERPGGMVWLWLEDIVEAYATPWPLERYGLAARHLGAWQGTYLAGRPLPDAPWLARVFAFVMTSLAIPHAGTSATGRTGEPVAPTNFNGMHTKMKR
ncbi:MAG TPA: hypothetical protein VEZ12_14040, partial [Herpetosiphonaceae bacterium]|nr:hypothetical protein [Herpetosiphonaceae bacterium]